MNIKFDKVSLTYPNGYKALHNINLDIKSGEFVALIGSSGSGKTTLISTVPKIWPISAGNIEIGKHLYVDRNTKGRMLRRIRKNTSIIFQSKNVIPELSVYDNVKAGILKDIPWYRSSYGGIFTKNEKERIMRAIDVMGLLPLVYTKVRYLSGGQQQRVALARAIVTTPEILLADEPVSALDVINAENVLNSIKRINKELGVTVIVNLHHIDLAIKYADRIIGMNDGRIVVDTKPKDITPAKLKKIYGSEVEDFSSSEIKESLRIAAKNEKYWSTVEKNEQEYSILRYKEVNKYIKRQVNKRHNERIDNLKEKHKDDSEAYLAAKNKSQNKKDKELQFYDLKWEERKLREKAFSKELDWQKAKQRKLETEKKLNEKLIKAQKKKDKEKIAKIKSIQKDKEPKLNSKIDLRKQKLEEANNAILNNKKEIETIRGLR